MIQESDEVLVAVAKSFSSVEPKTSLTSVIGRGRQLRNRRRALPGLTTTGVAAVTIMAVAMVSSSRGMHGSELHASGHAVNVDLAAWSVHTNPNATVTMTVRDFWNPDELRAVLARACIRADVQTYVSNGRAGICEQTLVLHGLPQIVDVLGSPMVRQVNGASVVTINPAAMPAGSVLVVDFVYIGHRGSPARAVAVGLSDGVPEKCVDTTQFPTPPSGR